MKPFKANAQVTISATTSSQKIAIPQLEIADASKADKVTSNRYNRQIRIEPKLNDVFIKFGDGTVGAATSTDLHVSVNAVEVFTINPRKDTHMTIISATATATVYVTTGNGN